MTDILLRVLVLLAVLFLGLEFFVSIMPHNLFGVIMAKAILSMSYKILFAVIFLIFLILLWILGVIICKKE